MCILFLFDLPSPFLSRSFDSLPFLQGEIGSGKSAASYRFIHFSLLFQSSRPKSFPPRYFPPILVVSTARSCSSERVPSIRLVGCPPMRISFSVFFSLIYFCILLLPFECSILLKKIRGLVRGPLSQSIVRVMSMKFPSFPCSQSPFCIQPSVGIFSFCFLFLFRPPPFSEDTRSLHLLFRRTVSLSRLNLLSFSPFNSCHSPWRRVALRYVRTGDRSSLFSHTSLPPGCFLVLASTPPPFALLFLIFFLNSLV